MKLPFDKLRINKDEAGALLFHYHKNGIPTSQRGAKELELKLCRFVGEEPKDEYIPLCAGAHRDGVIEGEINVRKRLNELRRENEYSGGDQAVVNAVRKIEEAGVL